MPRPVGGGDINAAWQVNADDRGVFLKTGPMNALPIFQAEAAGLAELKKASAIRVPEVLGCLSSRTESVLALEWIEFEPSDSATSYMLGEQLARQHLITGEKFGWRRDNTIGSTLQRNTWSDDWLEFFADHRLGFQLHLAERNGYTGRLQSEGTRLLRDMGGYFDGYWPEASLLHGDLWSGNWAACDGEPVVFDPAVYYGDRESDIAMSKLFGGFDREFYWAYEESWPMAAGNEQRIALYQLYHILNHLNLFGSPYLGRALAIMRTLC